MSENLSIIAAFGAGLLSFLSPCVLPLIPSWLGIIGGSPVSGDRPRPIVRTVSFISGFTVIFIILSIIVSVTFNLMGGVFRYINIIAGLIVIILGLNILFNFLSFLNFEKRFNLKNKPRGIIGAFLAGGAFGAGWTPCIGPILTGILILAAQSGGIPRAALYLFFFSAGLGLPFLLASIFYNAFLKISAKLRSHLPLIQKISGILLIVLGVLIATGLYQIFSAYAARLPLSGVGSQRVNDTLAVQENLDRRVSEEVIMAFQRARLPYVLEGIDIIDFSLPSLDGTEITLSGLRGKVVFLNFWATWCPPCRDEMPSMEALYQRLKDKGLEILAVNIREPRNEVSAFMNQYNLSFPAVLDSSGSIGSMYSPHSIPTTYIIDKRSLVVSRLVGSIDWYTPEIIAAFEALLDG